MCVNGWHCGKSPKHHGRMFGNRYEVKENTDDGHMSLFRWNKFHNWSFPSVLKNIFITNI